MGRQMLVVAVLLSALVAVFASGSPLPFVVLHGVLDACKNDGVCQFTQFLTAMTGAKGYCIEVGNGVSDSFFMRIDKQVDLVCKQVKAIPDLKNGFNLVGLSQGGLIGRAMIELCDGAPPVHTLITLASPHAGTASVPICTMVAVCMAVDALIKYGVYSTYVQNHLGPAGYVKIPNALEDYYKGCLFLPKVNNELPGSRNATYKARFSKLHHLVLIKFERDKVVIPKETAWFGYFPPNDFKTVLPPEETDLYKEDWIGLRALDQAGNVTFLSLCGNHMQISEFEAFNYVVPFLKHHPSPEVSGPVIAECGYPRTESRVFDLNVAAY